MYIASKWVPMDFHKERKWKGIWWRPWTWFRWRTMIVVENAELIEISLIGG